METSLRSHLLTCATAYAAARDIGVSTVGRLAAGDWRFFDRITTGKSFTARKYDEVIAWFAANWPDGTEWPNGVPTPQDEDSEAQERAA